MFVDSEQLQLREMKGLAIVTSEVIETSNVKLVDIALECGRVIRYFHLQ